MHEKALEKLKSRVVGSLKHCRVSENWYDYDSLNTNFTAIARTLAAQKSKYLTESDAYALLSGLLGDYFIANKEKLEGKSGALQDCIGETELLETAARISGYLASIPHAVHGELRLPSVTADAEEIRKPNPGIEFGFASVIGGSNGLRRGGLAILAEAMAPKGLYLRVSADGALTWHIDTVTNRSLVSSLKILLHNAVADGALIESHSRSFLTAFLSGTHNITKAKIFVSEETNFRKDHEVDLPLEICAFLEKLRLPERTDSASAVEKLLTSIESASLLIVNGDEEALRIRAATEWSFDSLTAENETTAFIKTCIGLEALLGDGESRESLTEALADRCSYLIATTIKGRKLIRDRFKEIYKLRSKVVHGVVTHLERDDQFHALTARRILQSAIRREISYLSGGNK